eukprot:Gb_05834 [translate_table: standard]
MSKALMLLKKARKPMECHSGVKLSVEERRHTVAGIGTRKGKKGRHEIWFLDGQGCHIATGIANEASSVKALKWEEEDATETIQDNAIRSASKSNHVEEGSATLRSRNGAVGGC